MENSILQKVTEYALTAAHMLNILHKKNTILNEILMLRQKE